MSISSDQPEPHGVSGARGVSDVYCHLCDRCFVKNRGLQTRLRACRKRFGRVQLRSGDPTDGGAAVSSGVPVAARLGDPVVRLVRCDEDVRRGRKRPRRASRSGKGTVGGLVALRSRGPSEVLRPMLVSRLLAVVS